MKIGSLFIISNNHTKFQNSFPKEWYCFHYIRFFLVTGFVLPNYSQLKILINYFSRLKQYLKMYNSSGFFKNFYGINFVLLDANFGG